MPDLKRKASNTAPEGEWVTVGRHDLSGGEQPGHDPEGLRVMETGLERGRTITIVPIIQAQQEKASEDGVDDGEAEGQHGEPPSAWTKGLINKECEMYGGLSKAAWVELKKRPSLKGLCDKCLVFIGRRFHGIMAVLHLEESAPSFPMKCPLCDVAYRVLKFYLRRTNKPYISYSKSQGLEICRIGSGYKQDGVDGRVWTSLEYIDLACPPEIPCPWGIFPSRFIPGAAETLQQALGWIRQCTRGHKCGSVGPAYLPSRLVKVGSSEDDVRVEETARAQGRYVCLSYCRRKRHPLQTTTENLDDHLKSISWSKIPKTFQDAICLTRKLGISYIWIDALCVIQDDEDEKVQHFQEMERIFGNAFLTIAATSAHDSSSGLYSDRHFCDITGMTPAGDTYWFVAKHHVEPRRYRPLFAEGLALQERLLSARVLHVTSTKLIFECREKTFGPEGEIVSLGKLEYTNMLGSDSPDYIFRGWRGLVEKYNTMALPDSSQKLPAISSLAKQIAARRPESSYLAGLWSDSLLVDLLWHNLQCAKRAPDIRAPSWSWAAIDGMIAHPKEISISYIEVIEARTIPATTNLTGAVSGGNVTLRGKVFAGTTYLERGGVRTRVLKLQGKEAYFFADYRGDGNATGFKLLVDVVEDPWIAAAGNGDLSKQVPVFCLRMGRESHQPGKESEYALVLQCVNEKEKVYMRIGMIIEKLRSEKPGCFETEGVQDTVTII